MEVTLSKVIQCCPECQCKNVYSENRCVSEMGSFEESVVFWVAELPRSNDNLGTKIRSVARCRGKRFLKWLLTEA